MQLQCFILFVQNLIRDHPFQRLLIMNNLSWMKGQKGDTKYQKNSEFN